jgi:membrane-associated protein
LDYGIYAILFLIIFVETGLVVMPFTGRFITIRCRHFCAGVHNDIGQTAELNLGITLLLLIIAAIVGDALNYFIGKNIGLKLQLEIKR